MNRRLGSGLAALALLSGCGGGGAGPSAGGGTGGSSGGAPQAGCSLRERQQWAEAQLREWYLFPETLPASLDPAGYATVQDYIDALTATARSQRRDRYFTFITSIAEENAYYSSGSSAGFGFRLSGDSAGRRVFISESFEGAPALAAGVDRGAEIVAIGASGGALRLVSDIIAAEGLAGVTAALGPATTGTARTFRIADAQGTREVTIAKADFSLAPVSTRYGARIIEDEGRRVGYVNLRTFISPAEPALRNAFGQFKAAGVSDVIVDLRYNGGGLISTAQTLGDLLGGGRSTNEIFSYTTFRPEKTAENSTRYFQPEAQSVAPTRIAFIGTGGTASASELVINSFLPYLGSQAALIGANTYGKPVGQIALDRSTCDDRLRVIALSTQNSARQGYYYDGLAQTVQASCQAADDIAHPLGDPQEASIRAALDFMAGRSCTPIGAAAGLRTQKVAAQRELLTPDRPNTAQREVPGLF